MAQVAFRADLKLATATLEAIERAVVGQTDDGLRPHLGASLIGRECSRALWYTFRWAAKPAHEARTLRLFARGQREEAVFADLLRAAGVTVVTENPETGEQYRFGAGHFGGSMDGACVGLPDAPLAWHCVEMKTHSAKSFNDLTKKGVADAKPEHWAQMQCYMAWTGMERALYMAVCKDDDRLHLERVAFDRAAAERLFEKAQRIIDAAEPPDGISDTPDYFQCRWCDYATLCHGTAAPLPNCRSCAHSTPVQDGQWNCARHGKQIPVSEQKAGCQSHRYIPALLAKWAEPIDADTEKNVVRYRNTLTGAEFENGLPPEGYESAEIHACEDKRAIGDEGVQAFREVFDGRVAA